MQKDNYSIDAQRRAIKDAARLRGLPEPIFAAFAAYFSDMLAKHTSKGKGERAAQGLYNGDIPFGYRSTGSKSAPEFDPDEYPGLRMIGELRIQGRLPSRSLMR